MKPLPSVETCPDLRTLTSLALTDETVRLAVLGMEGVGKSAVTVRYLTHRFIGEYKSSTDMMYHQVIKLDGNTVKVDIIDVSTSVKSGTLIHHNVRSWAEGFLLVFSLTEPTSFEHAQRLLEEIRQDVVVPPAAAAAPKSTLSVSRDSSRSPVARRRRSLTPQPGAEPADPPAVPATAPVMLVANKADLVHLRKIEPSEVEEISGRLGCQGREVSASDSTEQITELFHTVVRQCLALKRRRSGLESLRSAFSSLPRARERGSQPATGDGFSSLRRRRPRARLQLPQPGDSETQLVDIVSPVELRPNRKSRDCEPQGRTSDGESVCSGATSSGSSGSAGAAAQLSDQPNRKFSVFDVGRKLGSFISGGSGASGKSTPAPNKFTTSPLKSSVPDLSKVSLSEKFDTLKKSVKKVSV